MKENPLVSIGIPTYNRPQYIKKAIKSALSQSYQNLEINISDNGSPDPEVEKICCEFAKNDSRIKYYRHIKNMGPLFNYNYVLDNAHGDYHIYLADDDWLSENYVEKCLGFLLDNPDYSIAFGEMIFYSEDYKSLRHCPQVSFDEKDEKKRIFKYCMTAINSCLSFGIVPIKLAKNAIQRGHGRLPEDWIYMIKLLYFGKGKFIDNISYNALNNGASSNIDGLKNYYNLPNLTMENFWETLSSIVKNAIINDDFFLSRLNLKKRTKLANETEKVLMKNKNGNKKNKITYLLNKIKKIVKRIIR